MKNDLNFYVFFYALFAVNCRFMQCYQNYVEH